MSNIKQELERIKIPKELHERTNWCRKGEIRATKRRMKIHWLQRQLVSVLGCGILFSLMVKQCFEGLFQVTKFEKSANNEEISFGYHFDNLNIMRNISMVL